MSRVCSRLGRPNANNGNVNQIKDHRDDDADGSSIVCPVQFICIGYVRDSLCKGFTRIGHVRAFNKRFNKIAIQGKGPDGKWTRKPLAYQSYTYRCKKGPHMYR